MRSAVGGLALTLHGLVHLIGFVALLQLAQIAGMPYRTEIFAGRLDVGVAGAWLLGLLWLAAAIGFTVAGLLLVAQRARPRLLLASTILSVALCATALPAAAFGLVVDAAILGLLAVESRQRRWRWPGASSGAGPLGKGGGHGYR